MHHRTGPQCGNDPGHEAAEPAGGIHQQAGQGAFAHRGGEEVLHRLACPLQRQVLAAHQVGTRRPGPWSPAHRPGGLGWELPPGLPPAGAALADHYVVGGLQGRLGDLQHLAGGRAHHRRPRKACPATNAGVRGVHDDAVGLPALDGLAG